MNINIKYFTLLAVILLSLTFSCSDDDVQIFDEGGTVLFYQNIVNGFYDLGDLDNTFVAFDLNSGGDDAGNVVITKSFTGGAGTFGPVEQTTGSTGTFNISLNEAVAGLGITTDQVVVGDVFTFTSTAGSAVRSLDVNASCSSALAGTYAYVTTNYFCDDAGPLTGELVIAGEAGAYTLSDWTFGTYQECYGAPAASFGTLMLNDLCNTISVTGLDAYDDTWTMSVDDVSGAELTLTYSNTYGEFGTTVLTRADDAEWPPLRN